MSSWELNCGRCGASSAASAGAWCCAGCGGPLAWLAERRFDRSEIDTGATGLWRYARTLPLPKEQSISLGEVTTPLIELDLEGRSVSWKLDYLSPSGSYKDRGAAVLISALLRLGATHAVEDSSGNAAAAIAAYAAGAGMQCTVYAPAAASAGKLVQASAYGALVERVEGSRDDVATAAMDAAAATPGATYASHNWHPFFIEGVKTWAFEVWEQLGYRAPDAVVVPVGSGSILLGAHLAFSALLTGGAIDRMPRLFAAQPAACAPVHAAFVESETDTSPFPRTATIAEGASIADPVRGQEVLRAIRSSDGGTVAVSESDIGDALRLLARRGIYIEPTSAVAAAGARSLLRSGDIRPKEQTVVMLSGCGLKTTDTISDLLQGII